MKATFFKLHRKLSIFLAIPVLLWTLSGLLHPFMANWMRPEIAHTFLVPKPLKPSPDLLSPAEAYKDQSTLRQINLIDINGTPSYRAITTEGTLLFRDARSGQTIENAEQLYAEQLARAYLADQNSALVTIEKVEEFGSTYSYINRYLPAYRVVLDRPDGMQVVVDLKTGKLGTFDSPSKRVFSSLFSWLHTWSFLGSRDSMLRITIVLLVSLLTLAVGLTGIVNLILFKTKQKNGTQRKLTLGRKMHRSLGAFASLFFLMFSLSGIFHVAVKYNYDDSDQWSSQQSIPTSQLNSTPAEIIAKSKAPVSGISLASIDGIPHYRLAIMNREKPGQTLYLSARDLSDRINGETDYAISLATEFSGYPKDSVKDTEVITKFRKDYGFIQKRLPVTRVNYDDQPYWHYTVDTANAHMAQRTSPAGLVEALSFINLHKWHFLDPISKEFRDYATAFGVLSIAAVTLFGLSLLWKKRKANTG
ncbi:PepSY-associated TM region [Rubritalea squalenifaciens DSM 18772]|uniref:PepSY-associated TM region n=1 Tax=Rubritalea squalenifaciens DSM 18772 TaxID=1123071 RepID=A0A1M6B072_9BACT|nr:PepSY-associated TM helix domain-containing protein [Rubritalea squalenifaciens]SHI42077.1 PepSY-associated TM region [Rubritalea squalenifaciens DSM 18772]